MFADYHPYIDLSNHTHHNLPCLHTTHIQSHTTRHTVTTTHSPSQLHLLYTQNSLNTHHKLLVHIPQLFPYSASTINATAWPHSTPQTLTSTSKQILHYNKHLHHSCWYLKGTVYKGMASCENCETISGVYKSVMTSHLHYGVWDLYTWVLNFTLYSLQCTIPTNQSYYSQHTSTHNHSKTMNREVWCVWLERLM